MSVQTGLISSVGTETKNEMIEAMEAPCAVMNSLSEEVSSNAGNISTMTKNCFKLAAELEKSVSIKLNTLSTEIRERWEASLVSFKNIFQSLMIISETIS